MRPFRLGAAVLLVGALLAFLGDADGQVVQTLLAFGLAAAAIEVRLVVADRRRHRAAGQGSGAAEGSGGKGGARSKAPDGGARRGGRRRDSPGEGDQRASGTHDGEGAGTAGQRTGPSLLLERGSRSLVERAIGAEQALVIDTAAIDDADEPEHRTGVLLRVAPTGASLRFERRVDPPTGDGVVVTSGVEDLDAVYRIVAAHEDAPVPVPSAAARELVDWASEELEAELSDDLLLLRLPRLVAEERWSDLEAAGQRLAQAFRGDPG